MSTTELDPTILEELVELGPAEGIELVRDLVRIFFAEAPDRTGRMLSGLSENDCQKVIHAAHAMRGAAAGLGAVDMAASCARIERQARTGDLTGLRSEVADILEELPRLEERLGSLIHRFEAAHAGA